MKYQFILPLYVDLPRKTKNDKRVQLNLNIYRNLHHIVNNQVKTNFSPLYIEKYFTCNAIKVSYSIQKRSKRKYDLMNVVSIVDKFFLDWLVKNNFIPDDTIDNVCYGSISGSNSAETDSCLATVEVLK